MKKIAVLLAVVLLAGMLLPGALGEEESADKILFRGIPWLTRRADAMESMDIYDDVYGREAVWNKGISVNEIVCGDMVDCILGHSKKYSGDLGVIDEIGFLNNLGSITVAGYDPWYILLFYTFACNDNGSLEKTPDDARLYGAKYVFFTENVMAQYYDLIDKIAQVYGNFAFQTNDGNEIFKENGNESQSDNNQQFTGWYDDAGEAMLVIHYKKLPNHNYTPYDTIDISYVLLNGDSMLQQAMVAEQREAAGGSTDGL